MGCKSVERSRTPKPSFRRRLDFSPVSTLAAGGFMSEMHEVTPVSQPFPHFARVDDLREAAALLQIHPKPLQRLARKGGDTRHADWKIVALSHIASRGVGACAGK